MPDEGNRGSDEDGGISSNDDAHHEDEGKIMESGSHEELIHRDGLYRSIYLKQLKEEVPG